MRKLWALAQRIWRIEAVDRNTKNILHASRAQYLAFRVKLVSDPCNPCQMAMVLKPNWIGEIIDLLDGRKPCKAYAESYMESLPKELQEEAEQIW